MLREQRSTVFVKRHSSSTVTDDRRGKVTARGEPYAGDYAGPAAPLSSRLFTFANKRLKGYAVHGGRFAPWGDFPPFVRVPWGGLRIHSIPSSSSIGETRIRRFLA